MAGDSWECQGRQEHGWFGDGTCPKGDDREVQQVAYAALAGLPKAARPAFESWLNHGGLKLLQKLAPGWAKDADLSPASFKQKYFGEHGSDAAAAQAQAFGHAIAGAAPGAKGDAARSEAAKHLATMAQTVRPEQLSRTLSPGTRAQASWDLSKVNTGQNVQDLAKIMEAEAGEKYKQAFIPVGFTAINRMRKNNTYEVAAVSSGYAKGVPPSTDAIAAARNILNGTAKDPTNGATHFYSPRTMPKDGAPESQMRGHDTKGGLESVTGVEAGGKPVKNFRPSWTSSFKQEPVAGIRDYIFKFYKDTSDGPTR